MRIGHIESRLKGQRDTDRQPEQSDGETVTSEAGKMHDSFRQYRQATGAV
ncbi:MAG: hypothetical protein PUD20_02835 [bacterium]|nr:hypothetical protein [bacterium]